MPSAKEDILARIRSALADAPKPPEPERNYRRQGKLAQAQVLDMLVDRLVDYKANVYRETQEGLADRLSLLLGRSSQYLIPEGFNRAWLPKDTASRRCLVDAAGSEALSLQTLDKVDAVITGSTVSCAETGTIFLNSNPDEGRRAITLVPDHHICLVPVSSVVELIPEAIARISYRQPVTMISGPSATSDIELIRVEGVHGPRRLDVILVQ